MLIKFLALMALSLSLSLNAATVTYNGYTLDTDTNVVTGGGLEWLQWDETLGQSIEAALSSYAVDGWRLATNIEMAALLNNFNFGFTFSDSESFSQSINLYTDEYSYGTANEFIDLFSDTYAAAGFEYDYGDELNLTGALFGSDGDFDEDFKLASVMDEYTESDLAVQHGYVRLYDDAFLRLVFG